MANLRIQSLRKIYNVLLIAFLCFSTHCIYILIWRIPHDAVFQTPIEILSSKTLPAIPSYIARQSTATYEDSIQPYFSQDNKRIAWQRFFNGTGHVILFHARKAAGTTFEMWIKRLLHLPDFPWVKFIKKRHIRHSNHIQWTRYIQQHRLHWNFTFDSFEAYSFFHGHNHQNRINAIMNDNPYAIYVMAFRHPIDRIVSQYEFEWRWGCFACHASNTALKQQSLEFNTFMSKIKIETGQLSNDTVHQMKQYKFSNVEMEDFLQRVNVFELNEKLAGSKGYRNKVSFGAYLNNYYLWMFCCDDMFCNIKKDFEDAQRIKQCYNDAAAKIKSFDIVMVSEWMNDLRTRLYVNQMIFNRFVALNSYQHELFVDMVPVPYRHYVTDRGANQMINKQARDMLLEWNRWDLKLYQFVKRMVFQRVHKIWTPFDTRLLYNQTFDLY
eukprot:268696_1